MGTWKARKMRNGLRRVHTRTLLSSRMFAARAVVWGVLILCSGSGGCAHSTKPLFSEPDPNLHWPAAPAAARIRYLGSLSTSADLHPAKGFFDAIGDFLIGPGKPETLYGPRNAVVTRDGQRVWVADTGGRCFYLFDLERRISKRIQRLGGSPLLSPVGLCLGSGDSIFVCDSESGVIHRLSGRDGALLATLRGPVDLLRPVALHYDEAADDLWVVDAVGHDVKILETDGSLKRIVGRRGTGPGEFNYPCDITASGDTVWIADTGNHRVQALTREGTPIAAFGRAGDAPGDLALPKGVAVDPDGHVHVVDGRFENVQVFDPSGRLLLFLGGEGTGPGEFWLPGGMFIEPSGRMWVCDTYNRRIQVFSYVRDAEITVLSASAN